jgi:hypothetical protein
MAEKKQQKREGVSTAEDYYGRTTTVDGEPTEGLPPAEREASSRDRPGAGTAAPRAEAEEEETENPRGESKEERDPLEAFNAIPDGDGPRSDRGTNPLPESYWSAYPDKGEKGDKGR